MGDRERLRVLAKLLAGEIQGAPEKPKLRLIAKEVLIPKQSGGMDSIMRASISARIRDLNRMYSLGMLYRQETHDVAGQIECLSDERLSALLRVMERARECCVEGVGFDEAGLVRNLGDSW